MKKRDTLVLAVLLTISSLAFDRKKAVTFAELPAGRANPEGIAVDSRDGDVYAADFEFAGQAPGHVVVFDKNGKFLRDLAVAGSSNFLLGLDFHPRSHKLLVIDFGSGNVLDVNPQTGASTVFSAIGPGSGLNALTFDAQGFVLVSDSFQGIIWRIPPAGGTATVWKQDALLTTTGVPPFGANGIAFNKARTLLFVANTGNDSIVTIANNGATGGETKVFTNSINGADGLIIDENDNIWVCANQSDEIVVIDTTGKVIAKLGDFDGIKPNGAPDGLLFPASLVFAGNFLLVTNTSLNLELATGNRTIDSAWTAQVRTHTLARLPRTLPKLP
ncbi:MAG TPA: SMP-30/gluconolactonase/LRE family protein [Myxococcales bacterium]|nr:SMP-30/gluconolactonase/LRE family protein [Myxococcales bacterium]